MRIGELLQRAGCRALGHWMPPGEDTCVHCGYTDLIAAATQAGPWDCQCEACRQQRSDQ